VSGFSYDLHMIRVLWRRDLLLFWRQKSRVAGSFVQPLLFWLAIGAGLSPTFRLGSGDVGYFQYFYPGVVLLVVLMTTLFTTMSVIEDRSQGFLQGVLVAPGSRVALVLGKCLGSSSVAGIQAAVFLLLMPLAGMPLSGVHWGSLFLVLGFTALALSAAGFAVAWWLDSIQGYHVVMSVILFPLWILSGAMFPPGGLHPVLKAIVVANPLSYATAGLRRALCGGTVPAGTDLLGAGSGAIELWVTAVFAAAAVAAAAWTCARRPAVGEAAARVRR